MRKRERGKERGHIESDEAITVFEDFRSNTEQSRGEERLIQQAAKKNVAISHGGNGAGTLNQTKVKPGSTRKDMS